MTYVNQRGAGQSVLWTKHDVQSRLKKMTLIPRGSRSAEKRQGDAKRKMVGNG